MSDKRLKYSYYITYNFDNKTRAGFGSIMIDFKEDLKIEIWADIEKIKRTIVKFNGDKLKNIKKDDIVILNWKRVR